MDNQCGFFSLGFASRRQAIEQIIDNLVENNIYVLADKISGTSAALKVIMHRYVSKKGIIPAHYLKLYAKAHSLDLHGEELLEHLTAAYKKLETQINAAENTINAEFEALKIKKGLPARVPATDDGTIAQQFHYLRQPFEHRKWIEQAKITRFFYPLADFQLLIERNINEKFRSGMLEFDPNPEWEI